MTDLININKFLNNAIGFEDIFNRFSLLNSYNTGFPYYNIKKNAKADQYTLEMSLSGYKKEDLEVEVQEGILEIKGKAKEHDTEDYVYKGMAKRSFVRKLQLADYVEARGAELEDGILKIKLEYYPPEDKRAKKITIK